MCQHQQWSGQLHELGNQEPRGDCQGHEPRNIGENLQQGIADLCLVGIQVNASWLLCTEVRPTSRSVIGFWVLDGSALKMLNGWCQVPLQDLLAIGLKGEEPWRGSQGRTGNAVQRTYGRICLHRHLPRRVRLASIDVVEAGSEERFCVLCGVDISAYRKGARFCSRGHSAEASRIRRLLAGQQVDGYPSLAHRLSAAQKRTGRLLGAFS